MPAAMHLTILVSLFAVMVCTSPSTSSAAQQVTTSPTQPSPVTKTNDVSLSAVTTTNTQQSPAATHQVTTAVTLGKASSSPPPSTSPPQTTVTNQTSNETVSHGPTLPPGSETPNTTVNTTSPGFSQKGDLIENPGLVAILCIFCIVLALVLVVVTIKCIRSPRSNFERLEDVPLGKVSEDSPFAHYSK